MFDQNDKIIADLKQPSYTNCNTVALIELC